MAGQDKGIDDALFEAIKAMGPLTKDSTNPHFRNKYASLGAVLDVIEGPLAANKLTMIQPIDIEDGRAVLRTILTHTPTGQTLRWAAPIMCKDPDNPQSFGGAVTYLRRFSLKSLFGLNDEDDDGNQASQSRQPARQAPPANVDTDTGEIYTDADPAEEQRKRDLARISILWKQLFANEDAMRNDLYQVTGKESRADLTVAERRGYIRHLEKMDAERKLIQQAAEQTGFTTFGETQG